MFVLFVPYLFLADISFAKQCGHDEFLYKYTECDHHGERWRIAVPKTHSLQCDNVPPPQPGVNCSFSCSAGRYLDMESQECRVCPAGTYSLGDGVRYEEFTQFPPGFSVENYVDDTAQALSAMVSTDAQAPVVVCSNENGWVIQSGEIRYVPTPCISKLSISLHLVRSGFIEIYYKMPKNSRGLLAELTVRNEQCQSYGNARSYFRDHHPSGDQEIPTGNGDWRIRRLNLRAGQNLLTWTVSNNRELTTLSDVVYVPKIDIVGLAFTPSCTPCAKGAYSKSGAKQCEACQPGFFSNRGATKCEKCAENEYSGLRASKCIAKPPCHSFDYYPLTGSCTNNATSTTYQKLVPEVCQENSPASVSRPASETRACKPCSPGMYRSADGTCRFCGRGEYSSEGTECHMCPEHTTPNYGLFFANWDQMPSQLWTTCEYLASEDGDSCDVKPSWIALGDRIETAPTRAVGVALELSLNLTTGFYNPLRANTGKVSEENPIGWISFDLELTCADDSCLLYFVEVTQDKAAKRSFFRFLAAFNGTQKRQQFHYPVVRDRPGRFVFAFTRSGAGVGSDVINDKAVIYSLNITHTGDPETKRHFGGADSCLPCPSFDAVTGECRPCPAGHYIDAGDNRCIKCPPGTALNLTSSQVGPLSCVPCGPNLDSEDRTTCGFSGKLTLPSDGNRTMKFDFSALRNKSVRSRRGRMIAASSMLS
ncbi:Protein Y73F8A.5 [Aphelenchoides avenae]|nr:Protein Y73F8A.5 [Aphelenchus avenae]